MRRHRAAPLALVALLAACHPRVRPSPVLAPLGAQGDVRVYLQPLPEGAPRLAFTISALSASAEDGSDAPLSLVLADVPAPALTAQHLLATGRLPAGRYGALSIQLARASLATEEGVADLLVPKEPVRVSLPLELGRGRGVVVQLRLRPGLSQDGSFDFEGAFEAVALVPVTATVQNSAYATTPALASVSVLDRTTRQVTAVIPTGRDPRGIAVDASTLRGYVALAGEDQIQVVDLATGVDLRRIPLNAGDEPSDLALTPDGRTLVVANRRSNTVAFVDVDAAAVISRVQVGEDPAALLLEPSGRRAYVLDRRSSDLAVIDVGNRALLSRVLTDPEPLRAQLSRAGDRLFLVCRGSPYLTMFSIPELVQLSRTYVGLGTSAVELEPRSGYVYVANADIDRLQVFAPGALLPQDDVALPGPASRLGLDPIQNLLTAVVPSRGAVAFVDLTRRRVNATAELGAAPYVVVVPGGGRP